MGESEKDFMDRCLPMVMGDGSAKDDDQATAMCETMFKDSMSEANSHTGDIERRAMPIAQLRTVRGKGGPVIEGYASVFNSDSEDLGGFIEQVAPGAFKASLAAGDDVRALIDHDPSRIIGRSKAGTLELSEDATGLHVRIHPPNTQVARDLMESIDRGDISGMSFGFVTRKDAWDYKAQPMRRTILDAALCDVSPVTYPAYPETSVAMRSLEKARAEAAGLKRLADATAELEKRTPKQ
jgi:HK97 family phage prohead protease